MKTNLKILTVFVAVVLLLGLSGVAAHAGGLVDTTFNSGNFPANSNEITNPYWTLLASTTFVYYTMPKVGDGCEINYVWVKHLDDPVVIRDRKTQEVQDWVYADDDCDGQIDTVVHEGKLIPILLENTLDWYAQDKAGNVWYMGEHTEEYSRTPPDPGSTSTEGTWSANIPGALPGIIMLANPTPGDFYQQEYYADHAEDMAKVLRVNARVELTFDNPLALAQEKLQDEYEDCLKTKEWSPLEIGVVEHKYYCDGLFLLGNELQGGTVRTELVDYYSGSPDVEAPGFVFEPNPNP